jgi:hypothetical protein
MDHMEIRCRTVHGCRLDLSNSGHSAVVGSCKCGNLIFMFQKCQTTSRTAK